MGSHKQEKSSFAKHISDKGLARKIQTIRKQTVQLFEFTKYFNRQGGRSMKKDTTIALLILREV